jgi:hypothetical protein
MEVEGIMTENNPKQQSINHLSAVMADFHFWVPLAVLLGGLLLLRFIR